MHNIAVNINNSVRMVKKIEYLWKNYNFSYNKLEQNTMNLLQILKLVSFSCDFF